MEKIKKILRKYKWYQWLGNIKYQIKWSVDREKRKINASSKKIEHLKDSKKGKRCFIVGNGPSLSVDDLEMIKEEDSFAVNRIYKIFNQTTWRPTFYFSQDERVLEEIKDDMHLLFDECEGIFLNSSIYNHFKGIQKDNLYFVYDVYEDSYPEMPNFSMEANKKVYEGFTVAYACIQMAVYMGYSEIYIIGTDHNYSSQRLGDGTMVHDETVKNYMPGLEGNVCYPPQLVKSTLAFRKSREVCEKRGIVIRNATRGGKLEEFERVDFDSLF